MAKNSKSGLDKAKGVPIPLGATVSKDGINFAVAVAGSDSCRLNLYERNTGVLADSILLTEENRTGHIFSARVDHINPEELSYMYQVNEKEFMDPYAKALYGRKNYGRVLNAEEKRKLRGGFTTSAYQWQCEETLNLPYSKLILYKIHVRGFTMHPSSEVKAKGTFLGITEKIPYFMELGINCVQLMPIYEYNEIMGQRGLGGTDIINYWGYGNDNYYFAPKAAYSSDPAHAAEELKYMVDSLHGNGIEVIMEMNFIIGTNPGLIQDCLRYWAEEYHIDGFRLTSETVPLTLLAADPLLGKTKLFAEGWDLEQIYPGDMLPAFKNLGEYNSGYSVDIKRFLRGDEEQVKAAVFRIRRNPDKCGVINYITNHDGFTLMDLYSYDVKHNEKNGENNQDGADYNYSWNCGTEGSTRVKKILNLRKKQIRNALALLFLSQGSPLLLAGDEFGNTQGGNNNAYCQDNEISWLNWELLNTNRDIFNFVKQLIRLRAEHPILHMEEPLRSMDYISCGFPDLSFHGIKAWLPDYNHYSRVLGVMLAGNYVKINRKENDRNFYLGFNMHWEKHSFDLPGLSTGRKWHVVFDTNTGTNTGWEYPEPKLLPNQRQYEIAARSVVVLISK